MLGHYWWILPLIIFILGCIMAWYLENSGSSNSSSGYFTGLAFVITMILNIMLTLGIIIGHFI